MAQMRNTSLTFTVQHLIITSIYAISSRDVIINHHLASIISIIKSNYGHSLSNREANVGFPNFAGITM